MDPAAAPDRWKHDGVRVVPATSWTRTRRRRRAWTARRRSTSRASGRRSCGPVPCTSHPDAGTGAHHHGPLEA